MGYIETLFGHQDVITSVDSLRSETALTCGARDKSVRFWKVVEENQLVFRGGGRSALRDVLEGIPADDEEAEKRREKEKAKKGTNDYHEGSIDCVAFIDGSTFLSGGDSGWVVSLCVFNMRSKRPPRLTELYGYGPPTRKKQSTLTASHTAYMRYTLKRKESSGHHGGSPRSLSFGTRTSSPRVHGRA